MDRKLNRIKTALVDNGKTNKWLAEQLGKDPATVSKWCTNACQPSLEMMITISKLLKVDLTTLYVLRRFLIQSSRKLQKIKMKLTVKYHDMSCDNIDFVTYCIGNLSRRLNMSAVEVYRRLKQSGILSGYIVPSYDVLHTFGKEYLMEDLTEYMREKGVLA